MKTGRGKAAGVGAVVVGLVVGTAAVPALHDALQDENAGIRVAAAEALKRTQRE